MNSNVETALYESLKHDLDAIERFYQKRYHIIHRKVRTELGRYGIDIRDARQPWERVDINEVDSIFQCLLDIHDIFGELIWYGKVNQNGFLRIFTKIKRTGARLHSGILDLESSLHAASFASQESCLSSFFAIGEEIPRLRDRVKKRALGHYSLFLPRVLADCGFDISPISMYLAIANDDKAAMIMLLEASGIPISRSKDHFVFFDLLDYSILKNAARCAGYLLEQVGDEHGTANSETGDVFHHLVIGEGRMHKSKNQNSPTLCKEQSKLDTNAAQEPISLGFSSIVKLSKKQPSMVQREDTYGRLPLHYAAEYGHSDLCSALLYHSDAADSAYAPDTEGITPLHLAIMVGSVLTIKVLLRSCTPIAYSGESPITMRILNSCLIIAIRLRNSEIATMLTAAGAHVDYKDPSGESPLYHAVRNGLTGIMENLLKLPNEACQVINQVELSRGRSPLISACMEGHLPLVEQLLEYGADPDIYDLNGWTAKNHAVFRGHLSIAKILPPFDPISNNKIVQAYKAPQGFVLPQRVTKQARYISRAILENHHYNNSGLSKVLVTLGPMNTRRRSKSVDLSPLVTHQLYSPQPELGYILKIASSDGTSYSFDLPVLIDTANEPMLFTTNNLHEFHLDISVYRMNRHVDDNELNKRPVGRGIAFPCNLQDTLGVKHESLYRDYTIPLLDVESLGYVGNVILSLIAVKAFPHQPRTHGRKEQGFWNEGNPTQIIGHRGSGANNPEKSNLQIGENTIQSFLTACDLGASCVEFDVQLTKDYRTVIFHDFLVMATGGNVPLHTLTYDQFMHLGKLQSPKGNLSGMAEARYWEKTENHDQQPRPRSYSLDTFEDSRSRDLINRMKYTEEGVRNDIKGNLRGHSIQEPATTLEQLLTELPETMAFNLEISKSMVLN